MLRMVIFVFFFKQKTAYEMRISDWSSDVCSSDLLIFMPIVIVMLLGMAYGRYGDLPFVAQGFRGLSAAAAGLVVAMAVQIAWPVLRSLRAVALALVIFLAIGALRLPLVWVLLVLVPIALLWAWHDRDD